MSARPLASLALLLGACSSSEPTKAVPPPVIATPPPPAIDAAVPRCATVDDCAREFVDTGDQDTLARAIQLATAPDQRATLERAVGMPEKAPPVNYSDEIFATLAPDAATKRVRDAYDAVRPIQDRTMRALAIEPVVALAPFTAELEVATAAAEAAAKATLPAVAADPVKRALMTVLSGDTKGAIPLCKAATSTDPKQSELLARCATDFGTIGRANWSHHDPVATPTLELDPAVVIGALDKVGVRRFFKRNANKIRYCYDKALLADAKLAGVVVVTFTVTETGAVADASAKGLGDVASCVQSVVAGIVFRKPTTGSAKITQTFRFAPN